MLPSLLLMTALVLLSGFFSASETAIFSLSRVQLHRFRETKRQGPQALVRALKHPRQILITILLGNEFINVCISIVGAAIIARLFHASALGETLLAVAVITPIVLILGEIVPKNLALRFAPLYAQFAIRPLTLFSAAVRPVRFVLTKIADAFIIMLGGHPSVRPMIMEQEYRHLVDLGRREGEIIEEERELIHNIFEFHDKRVTSIMTPAARIFSLSVDTDYEAILQQLNAKRVSRVPFFQGTPDNIIGILHVRDLFSFDNQRGKGGERDIRSILIPPLVVGADEKLESLLRRFQRERVHMAMVKNPDGSLIGLVTMDDILEDMFGEIEE